MPIFAPPTGGLPPETVTTCADMIAETRLHLHSMHRDIHNQLATSYTAGGPTLQLTHDVSGVAAGAYVSIDLEIFYVWSVNQNTKTLTVSGGQLGSTASDHAAGKTVYVNPKFTDFAIFRALNAEIAGLSSPRVGLFRVRTLSKTTSTSGVNSYNLSADVQDIISVKVDDGSTAARWPTVDNYTLLRDLPAATFASGIALRLDEGVPAGKTMTITYRASYAGMTTLNDEVDAVTGLHGEAHDLPPLGAVLRLVLPREIKRNFTEGQPDARRGQEVPPGAVANSVRTLAGLRNERIAEERARLARLYPHIRGR